MDGVVRQAIRAAGEVLLIVGLVGLLFIGYLVWGTGLRAASAQRALSSELNQQWQRPGGRGDAVGGSVMYYYLVSPIDLAAGASGAIFGLFGAWFVVARRLRLDTRGIVVLIAINLALGFFFHSFIAWQAHIGGLLTGALLTAAYAYAPRKNRAAVQAAATVAVVALIVVAVAVRNGQLTGGGF